MEILTFPTENLDLSSIKILIEQGREYPITRCKLQSRLGWNVATNENNLTI